MTTLNEKAEQANSVELRRASESVGVYRIEDIELTPANELTDPEQYPEHGDWLRVTRANGVEQFLETPSGLAAQLVDLEVEVGDVFEIGGHRKIDSEWQFGVRVRDLDELPDDVFEQTEADDWTEDLW